jgi:Cyclopropane fatty acid synthase and related methyltransferases
MLHKLFSNFRKPEGFLGGLIAGLMNKGHAPLTRQVVDQLDVRPGDVVLDIGCGGGGAIRLMAERAVKVHGVDYSEASVRKSIAANKAGVAAGKVAIEVADVRALPFPAEMFTLVTAFETVFFWPDLEECFRGILKILKKGGCFAIVAGAWKEGGAVRGVSDFFVRNIQMNIYSPDEYRELLESAGFAPVTQLQGEKGDWICMVAEK